MSNQSSEDRPQKKKNAVKPDLTTRITLQVFVILAGGIATNAGYNIVQEIFENISELRTIDFNPILLVIFIISTLLTMSLLRIIFEASDDDLLLEETDDINKELNDTNQNPRITIENLPIEDASVIAQRLAESYSGEIVILTSGKFAEEDINESSPSSRLSDSRSEHDDFQSNEDDDEQQSLL